MIAHLLAVILVNDANWVSFGGAGAFAPHKTVHMLGEDINITLYDDKIHVRVYFSFENKGPATTVKMAFPFSTVNWNKDLVRSFSSKVDGKAVSLERLKNVPIVEGEKEVLDEGWARNEIYVKEVSFDQGQRRTVLVDYTTGRGMAGGGWLIDEYVISSGAGWAGKIGTISVSVDWSKTKWTSPPDLYFRRRDGSRIKADWTQIRHEHATTTLSDVEPDFDLDLSCVNGFWNVWLNGKRLESEAGVAAEHGATLVGDPSDPLAVIYGLDAFIDELAKRQKWPKSRYGYFGDWIARVPKGKQIEFSNGRSVPLRRSARDEDGEVVDDPKSWDHVYLKDFIEALGGTFKWNAELERIDITLPK